MRFSMKKRPRDGSTTGIFQGIDTRNIALYPWHRNLAFLHGATNVSQYRSRLSAASEHQCAIGVVRHTEDDRYAFRQRQRDLARGYGNANFRLDSRESTSPDHEYG